MGLRGGGAWMLVMLAALAAAGCSAKPGEVVIAVPVARGHGVQADRPWPLQQVTADQLYVIYSQHLVEGALPDQRFWGRPLEVTGVFAGVDRSLPGREFVELETHDADAFAYAELRPEARDLLTTLKPGDKVALLCRGAGMVVGSPLLRDCRAAEPPVKPS